MLNEDSIPNHLNPLDWFRSLKLTKNQLIWKTQDKSRFLQLMKVLEKAIKNNWNRMEVNCFKHVITEQV